MFPEQLSFRFSIITFAILFACSNTADGDFYDDLDRYVQQNSFNALAFGASTSACIEQYRSDFNECYDTMKSSYADLMVNLSDFQGQCCNLLEYRLCVAGISYINCGNQGPFVYNMLIPENLFQCQDYIMSFSLVCFHPVLRIGVYLICAVVGLVLIYGLCRLFKKCFR